MKSPSPLIAAGCLALSACHTAYPTLPPDLPTISASASATDDWPPRRGISMSDLDDRYILLTGDIIVLRISSDDPSKIYSIRIRDDGSMVAPYIGRVSAGGLTCRQLALNIQRELEAQKFRKSSVLVELMTEALVTNSDSSPT